MSNVKKKVLAMLVLGGIALPLIVWATVASVGVAELTPRNHSGVHATIVFMDDGTTLTFTGTATGLDPSGFYVSLVYDNKSVPGGPGAPNERAREARQPKNDFLGQCEPSQLALFSFDDMFLEVWVVDFEGNGTLNGTMVGYRALSDFRTVSIRDALIDDGVGPDAVVACGTEHHAPYKLLEALDTP